MSVVEPVARQLAAYNQHNLAEFIACYAPDVRIYRMPASAPSLQGRDALAHFYATARFTLPKLQAAVLSRQVVGNKVIDHERVTGLRDEPYEVAVVYEVHAGLISQVWFFAAD